MIDMPIDRSIRSIVY